MKIALIDFNNAHNVPWTLGPRVVAGNDLQEINGQITLLKKSNDYIFFFNSNNNFPTDGEFRTIVQSRGNLWHGGKYANGAGFSFLSYNKPCWMLDLNPHGDFEYISWKINCRCALFPIHVFDRYGLLNEGFSSLDAAFFEWGYYFVNNGGIPVYKPELASENPVTVFNSADQVLFMQQYFPVFWIRWALWRAFGNGKITLKNFLKFWNAKQLKSNRIELSSTQQYISRHATTRPYAISVVIITLNRYRFLKNVIHQLAAQTIPVAEIIVVDASPLASRQTEWIKGLNSIVNLKVIYSEVIGQCTQRNIGISNAVGELIYFCDDDMEQIPPDHLEKHVNNIAKYRADVSSGLPDEVGHHPIDRKKLRISVSTVFPTNDSLVFKSKVNEAGLFDVWMDRGQSEDHDLGVRIFLTGGLMVLDPQLRSLHLRAGSGGLREHKVRVVTAASSKSSFVKFRLLHLTEIYLNLKYFTKENVRELIIISMFATFRINGSFVKKALKFFTALLYLPLNAFKLSRRYQAAKDMIKLK